MSDAESKQGRSARFKGVNVNHQKFNIHPALASGLVFGAAVRTRPKALCNHGCWGLQLETESAPWGVMMGEDSLVSHHVRSKRAQYRTAEIGV